MCACKHMPQSIAATPHHKLITRTLARRNRTIYVFYGSATGNSEFIAKRIHGDCQARCVPAECARAGLQERGATVKRSIP